MPASASEQQDALARCQNASAGSTSACWLTRATAEWIKADALARELKEGKQIVRVRPDIHMQPTDGQHARLP